ncbi:hypothetical protein R3I94_009930 [Phoxinus phoxinus]
MSRLHPESRRVIGGQTPKKRGLKGGERLPVREGESEGLFSDFKHTVSVQKIPAALSPSEGPTVSGRAV